jgi:hypothetical protein
MVQLVDGKDGRPQHVFSCPYSQTDCPSIKLSNTLKATSADISCAGNHGGPLCATCKDGFSRRGADDNTCEECKDTVEYIQEKFGVPVEWFASIIVAAGLVAGAAAYLAKMMLAKFMWIKAETQVNQRILLGEVQVLSLLPSVLALMYPPKPKAALHWSTLLTADLKNILRVKCWGWTWYDKWLSSVFGMPALALLLVALHWLASRCSARRVDSDSRDRVYKEAQQTTIGLLFFVGMYLYPGLSASILAAVRCRSLGPGSSFLEVDYSVDCYSEQYSTYKILAYVLVVVVPVGWPLVLLAALLHQWRQSQERWHEADNDNDRAHLRASLAWELEAGGDMQTDSFAEYHRKRAEHLFGFLVADYRPECFWYEPVDMLRKLALSGLLQFIHRGTAAQCFCGCAISFASFGVQQWLRPYREHESNVLKALVDTQLFLTFLISFILRVLPEINSSEPFGKEFYGYLLLSTMVGLVGCAIGLTFVQVRRRRYFKEGLLANEEALGSLSVRGQTGLRSAPSEFSGGAEAALMDHDESTGAFTVGQADNAPRAAAVAVTAAGLSRPASPQSSSSTK